MEFGHRQPRTLPDDHDGGSRDELIPGLPHDIALECFLRLPHTAYPSACCVSKSWRSLLRGRHFYALRRSLHRTCSLACLVQQSPPYASSTERDGAKPAVGTDRHSQPQYSISVFDPGSLSWTRVPPIPDFPDGLPLFCQLASTDGKLLVLGGWDPVTYDSLRRVYLHDFVSGEWQRRADMPGMRSFFGATGADSGRVFVAGGHDDCKNALESAWVYDVEQNVWEEMEGMSQERDECEGMFVGTEFWVVSGYKTERQGGFEGSADVYEIGEGGRPRRGRRVEGVWQEGKCPRGEVCPMNRSAAGSFCELREEVSGVQSGMCSVSTARKVIVFGSDYQGGKQGLYVAEREDEGKLGKFMKVEVPEEFSGFVQSGCCVDV